MKSFFPFTSKPLPVQLVSASIPPLSTHVLETWVNGGYNSGLPSTFLQTFTLTNFRVHPQLRVVGLRRFDLVALTVFPQ
jgi:hypothetical protein